MLELMRQRDASYDGRFIVGVVTTGIFCLPSCGARKPKPENVRFFSAVDEARAAGLRPCKRCRPDLFYQDHDPDRAVVEELVGSLRADPAELRNVGDLVRRSGVGASKLSQLFRRHYHTTPLAMLTRLRIERARRELLESEKSVTAIGFDVGYETLSAFHDNFRGQTGMSPQAYRRLLGADRFTVDLPAWFSPRRALRYLGRDPASPTQRVDGEVFSFAAAVDGVAAAASAKIAAGRAECAIEPGSRPPAAGWAPVVHARLLRLLGLVTDPLPFERRLRRSEHRRLIEGQRGLTVPQTHDLVDALVWVIVGQQVSLPVAFALRRRLIERYGRRAPGGFALPPALETLANVGYADLQAAGFSRRKAEYLVDLARAATAGELDLGALERAPATVVERRLLAVRGLGPWSVHYLMMRALALADCVPVGDVALAKSLALFFGLGERPDKPRVIELMKPFAPYRSLATFHLWNRLGNAQ